MPRVVRSKRKKTARRRRHIYLASISGALFVLVVVALWLLSNVSWFAVEDVDVVGARTIKKSEVEKVINKEMEGKHLFIFSKKNSLLFPSGQIEKHLIKKYPKIKEIDVSLSGLKSVRVEVKEREQFALWCGVYAEITSCLFMDDEGFAYEKAPNLNGNSFVRFEHVNGEIPRLGKKYLDGKTFVTLLSYKDFLDDVGLGAERFVYESHMQGIFYVKADVLSVPEYVRVDMSLPVDLVYSNLQTSYENQVFNERDEFGQLKKLEYIDLRNDNKVFFKFK